MPVVVVTATALAGPAEEVEALAALATAVSTALTLPASAVHVTLVHAVRSVLGTTPVPPWPVILLYGSPRPAAEDALHAAKACAASIWSCPPDEVWVQWLTT
ncbi:hypothetical protein acdb102_30700 [Acidothermaceae bacterium B102]|nr:hypothetical protein acdb102_30700 [Acidothermaceae bacterium B102]